MRSHQAERKQISVVAKNKSKIWNDRKEKPDREAGRLLLCKSSLSFHWMEMRRLRFFSCFFCLFLLSSSVFLSFLLSSLSFLLALFSFSLHHHHELFLSAFFAVFWSQLRMQLSSLLGFFISCCFLVVLVSCIDASSQQQEETEVKMEQRNEGSKQGWRKELSEREKIAISFLISRSVLAFHPCLLTSTTSLLFAVRSSRTSAFSATLPESTSLFPLISSFHLAFFSQLHWSTLILPSCSFHFSWLHRSWEKRNVKEE